MRLTIFITALVLFASGIGLGFLDKVSASVATYAAAVLGLVFVFLPEFKKFKGLGIEAELLDRKIEEADKLIAQLRDITVPIAEMLLSATARMGRLGSAMSRHQKYDLLQRRCSKTPMILCVSCFILGLSRRSQTYILSNFMSYWKPGTC